MAGGVFSPRPLRGFPSAAISRRRLRIGVPLARAHGLRRIAMPVPSLRNDAHEPAAATVYRLAPLADFPPIGRKRRQVNRSEGNDLAIGPREDGLLLVVEAHQAVAAGVEALP